MPRLAYALGFFFRSSAVLSANVRSLFCGLFRCLYQVSQVHACFRWLYSRSASVVLHFKLTFLNIFTIPHATRRPHTRLAYQSECFVGGGPKKFQTATGFCQMGWRRKLKTLRVRPTITDRPL